MPLLSQKIKKAQCLWETMTLLGLSIVRSISSRNKKSILIRTWTMLEETQTQTKATMASIASVRAQSATKIATAKTAGLQRTLLSIIWRNQIRHKRKVLDSKIVDATSAPVSCQVLAAYSSKEAIWGTISPVALYQRTISRTQVRTLVCQAPLWRKSALKYSKAWPRSKLLSNMKVNLRPSKWQNWLHTTSSTP